MIFFHLSFLRPLKDSDCQLSTSKINIKAQSIGRHSFYHHCHCSECRSHYLITRQQKVLFAVDQNLVLDCNRLSRIDMKLPFRAITMSVLVVSMSTAWTVPARRYLRSPVRYFSRSLPLLRDKDPTVSSYQVADIEDRLQNVSTLENPLDQLQSTKSSDVPPTTLDGIYSTNRYSALLTSVGLEPHQMKHVMDLPSKHVVTSHDVFCNRELNLRGVRAIGFDMDYTLAQYQQPAFDQLAFDGAKEKLVTSLGYPKEVLDFQYNHTFWNRGLIIDTQRGNFLKIDRHKYVRVAYHGFDRISSVTRKHLYSRTFNKVMSFSEKHFVNMGTSVSSLYFVLCVTISLSCHL
jgi:hypothetical protein